MLQHSQDIIKISLPVRLFLLMMTFFILAICSIDSIWSTSTDLAHHYSLIARLSEFPKIPFPSDPSLGEMNLYPRSSHLFAAVIGRIFGSAFIGMQITNLLSIILLWSGVSYIILSLPKKAGYISAIILAMLLWTNHEYVHLELHADEIIENFFFAQLVGQACAIFIISLMLFFDQIEAKHRYLFLAISIYVVTGIHLLPALEILAFFMLLVTLDQYRQFKANKLHWRDMGFAILIVIATVVALSRHPAFAIMSSLSNNNGGITAHYVQSINSFGIYSICLIVSSGFYLRFWLGLKQEEHARQLIAFKYIGLYGLAVAGLCLLQVLAFKLGRGSEYSVKKYIFGLHSILLIEIALLFVWMIYQYKRKLIIEESILVNRGITYNYLLPVVLTSISYFCVIPVQRALETSEIVALERQLLLRHDVLIPSIPGKFNYVLGINKLPQNVAYMMSIGILKAPRSWRPDMSSSSWWIDDWSKIGTLVTSENSFFDEDPSCRRSAPVNSLVLLDGTCVAKGRGGRSHINFTNKEDFSTCITQGMGTAENFGTWTISKTVSISCQLPVSKEKKSTRVEIDTSGFLDHVPEQRVTVNIKGEQPVEYHYDIQQPTHLIKLNLPPNLGKEVKIDFLLPNASSPKHLGLSEDTRELGIAIKSVSFK